MAETPETPQPPLLFPGDLVILRSGGPRMTLGKILPSGTAICSWFEEQTTEKGDKVQTLRRIPFKAVLLEKVEAGG